MSRRKILIVCFGLTIGLLLNACAITKGNSVEQIEKETQLVLESTENLEISQDKEYGEDLNSSNVQNKVFEGCYFDESVYKYNEIAESESPLVYCEIMISNVTNTSFDFSIDEIVMATKERKMIVSLCTAVFIEDGERAVYYGDNQTLYFAFPDEKELYPKHIEVFGLEKMEGKIYMNNTIPGHESG